MCVWLSSDEQVRGSSHCFIHKVTGCELTAAAKEQDLGVIRGNSMVPHLNVKEESENPKSSLRGRKIENETNTVSFIKP